MVDRGIGLRSGVWLHVGIRRTEQFLRAIDGQLFYFIDYFTATVVALPWISFGILVGQNRTHRLDDLWTGKILGGDQFDSVDLTFFLFGNKLKNTMVAWHNTFLLNEMQKYELRRVTSY